MAKVHPLTLSDGINKPYINLESIIKTKFPKYPLTSTQIENSQINTQSFNWGFRPQTPKLAFCGANLHVVPKIMFIGVRLCVWHFLCMKPFSTAPLL